VTFEVDTERLGREAEALGSHRIALDRVRAEIDSASALAMAACGRIADGGLAGALGRLGNAWRFDIDAMAKDMQGISDVMKSLAQLYGGADRDNAQALRE